MRADWGLGTGHWGFAHQITPLQILENQRASCEARPLRLTIHVLVASDYAEITFLVLRSTNSNTFRPGLLPALCDSMQSIGPNSTRSEKCLDH